MATPNLVPRNDGEGLIGVEGKKWDAAFFSGHLNSREHAVSLKYFVSDEATRFAMSAMTSGTRPEEGDFVLQYYPLSCFFVADRNNLDNAAGYYSLSSAETLTGKIDSVDGYGTGTTLVYDNVSIRSYSGASGVGLEFFDSSFSSTILFAASSGLYINNSLYLVGRETGRVLVVDHNGAVIPFLYLSTGDLVYLSGVTGSVQVQLNAISSGLTGQDTYPGGTSGAIQYRDGSLFGGDNYFKYDKSGAFGYNTGLLRGIFDIRKASIGLMSVSGGGVGLSSVAGTIGSGWASYRVYPYTYISGEKYYYTGHSASSGYFSGSHAVQITWSGMSGASGYRIENTNTGNPPFQFETTGLETYDYGSGTGSPSYLTGARLPNTWGADLTLDSLSNLWLSGQMYINGIKVLTSNDLSGFYQSGVVYVTGDQIISGEKTFTSQIILSGSSGQAPFVVKNDNTGLVTGLNVDLLDGYHATYFVNTGQTGSFVTTGQTGVYENADRLDGQHGTYYLDYANMTGSISGTGVFVTTGQTGQFATTGWVDVYYYPRSNPSGYITSAEVSGSGVLSLNTLIGDITLTGVGTITVSTGLPNSIIISGSVGSFATTGWVDTNYYPRSNPSGYVTTGQTGIYENADRLDGQHGVYYLNYANMTGSISGTGSFITTGQTGQFVSTGSTGVFVTTGQTGVYENADRLDGQHGVYYLNYANMTGSISGTGSFVTTGQTGVYENADRLDGQHGVYYLNYANMTGSISGTGIFITTGQTGQFVFTGSTGAFVTTGQTGVYENADRLDGQHGAYYLNYANMTGSISGTGIFITTGQTGQFVFTGATGAFVTTGQTGVYENADRLDGQHGAYYRDAANLTGVLNTGVTVDADTFSGYHLGYFVNTGQTGSFVTTGQTGVYENADRLDGQHGTYYLNYTNFTGAPIICSGYGRFGPVVGATYSGYVTIYPGDQFPSVLFVQNSVAKAQILTDVSAGSVYFDFAGGTFSIRNAIDSGASIFTLYQNGGMRLSGLFESIYSTGSPFSIVSTGLVTNLNVDYLDNQHGTYYLNYSNMTGSISGTGTFITTGQTGVFSNADTVDSYHASYFVNTGQTGSFVTTGQTGVYSNADTLDSYHATYFVSTGSTGAFVTTGQTGVYENADRLDGQHGSYYLNYGNMTGSISGTGSFVTTGQTGVYENADRLDGQHGVYYLNYANMTGSISGTGIFITTGQTGQFVSTGSTGAFVTTGQTGVYENADRLDGQHGVYYLNYVNMTGSISGTGSFVTTGQTGVYENADRLDGQHGAYYLNYGNFTGGNISTPNAAYFGPTGAGTFSGNVVIYPADQYSTIFYRSGGVAKAQILVDVSGGSMYIDSSNAFYFRSAVDTGANLVSIYNNGNIRVSGQQESIYTGGPPFIISATGLVLNLNVDYLDNQHGAYYLNYTNMTGSISGTGSFITTGQTGQFVSTGQTGSFATTGWVDTNYYPRSNPSGYVRTGETGVFSNADTLDGYHATYFVNTGQTGGFVTTGQTGVYENADRLDGQHGAYYLNNANMTGSISGTGSFVTTGQTGVYENADRLDGQHGVYYLNYANMTGSISGTGSFITTGQTGQFVSTGSTGAFVTTGQTGVYENADRLDGQHGSYYLNYGNFTGGPISTPNSVTIGPTGAGSFSGNIYLVATDRFPYLIFRSNAAAKSQIIVDASGGAAYWDAVSWSFRNAPDSGATVMSITNVGTMLLSGQFQSLYTGGAPFSVASSTVVTNLNSDLLDGQHSSYYVNTGQTGQFLFTGNQQAFTVSLPSGIETTGVSFPVAFGSIPKVLVTMEITGDFLYAVNIKNRTTTGFIAVFSDALRETGCLLNVFAII